MSKKINEELRKKLENRKILLERELRKFAKKDDKLKDDWDTKFPRPSGGVGSQAMEDAADQVEEYATLLPIEYSLELQLRDVNVAIGKIKKGEYGKCEKCNKEINKERLKIYPEARTCNECKK